MKPAAIVIGCVTDYLCTRLFMLALLLVLLDPGSSNTLPYQYMPASLIDAFCATWGIFFTGLGAWVAARRAPEAPLLHAGGVGVVSIAISHLSQGWCPDAVGLPLYVAGTCSVLPVALLGGYLARFGTKV